MVEPQGQPIARRSTRDESRWLSKLPLAGKHHPDEAKANYLIRIEASIALVEFPFVLKVALLMAKQNGRLS